MALPVSAFDQIRRDTTRTPGWSGRLLMFAGTVFFVSIVAYFGLAFGYRPYLEKQIADHEKEAQKFSQEIPTSLQNEIVQFYSQLSNIKTLLAQHDQPSKLFEFLESRTATSNIYFDRLNLNLTTRELQVSGKARTVADIGAQLQILQSDPAVERMVTKTVSSDATGLWSFDLSIFLNQPLLRGQSATSPSTSATASSSQP